MHACMHTYLSMYMFERMCIIDMYVYIYVHVYLYMLVFIKNYILTSFRAIAIIIYLRQRFL